MGRHGRQMDQVGKAAYVRLPSARLSLKCPTFTFLLLPLLTESHAFLSFRREDDEDPPAAAVLPLDAQLPLDEPQLHRLRDL